MLCRKWKGWRCCQKWTVINIRFASTDLYPSINELCKSEWQQSWDNCVLNKLHTIVPFLGTNRSINGSSHRDSVVITRLRIKHTRLTHSYLLSKENRPECFHCHVTLTVNYFLVECPLSILIDGKISPFLCYYAQKFFWTCQCIWNYQLY